MSRSSHRTVFLSGIFIGVLLTVFWPNLVPAQDETGRGHGKRDFSEIMAELQKVEREVLDRGYTFSVGYNPAADYTIEQLCGLRPPPDQLKSAELQATPVITALPPAFDWRDNNGVTPVKDQGYCGSCWAFSTVAVLEHQIKILCGTTVDLSEQYLVSCNLDGMGCNGGWWAHDYHQSPGAVPESEFPYAGQDLACGGPYSHPYQIDWWSYTNTSVGAIKQAIYDYGAVAASICVGPNFQHYTGGIFNADESSSCTEPYLTNHGITLVGWNDDHGVDDGYWILKNSWGPYWGENGYMRIRYNMSRVGYGASYVEFSGCGTSSMGSVRVTIAPLQAISAGAQWRVDGGTWRNSGDTAYGLTADYHLIEFKEIPGWNTPASRTVFIQSGETTYIEADYVLQTGNLKVTLLPVQAVGAGAQWRVDGETWRNSGDTAYGLTADYHLIEFKEIPGWNTPASRTVFIQSEGTTYIEADYVLQTGNLKVTLLPVQAVGAGAQWRVDGETWRNSGDTAYGLAVGQHRVDFKDVPGWNMPPSQTVTISNNTTSSIEGVYTVHSGSLSVAISPAAAAQIGAQWRVDGGVWRNSGSVVTDLTPGDHVVDFKDLAGWTKPNNLIAAITNGETTSLAGVYSAQSGSATLTVSILAQKDGLTAAEKDVVTANAQWRIDGGAWHGNGDKVLGLSLGLHLLEFSPLPGWRTPSAQVLQITTTNNAATGIYTPVKSMPWLSILLE
ncbi:C1 family peptidase [Desulfoferrobacter suflitae]|uniref:C1 family peptidase n=1 Tax=Desulfoferrobacter suflitae TaxID=2865782 RepID=UPI0021649522|nr:C1 family peptidase [Desulfoferrobacter suflitae]MCK8603284.1 C1 family peptidase [Desulfoferrobacter suflitae]